MSEYDELTQHLEQARAHAAEAAQGFARQAHELSEAVSKAEEGLGALDRTIQKAVDAHAYFDELLGSLEGTASEVSTTAISLEGTVEATSGAMADAQRDTADAATQVSDELSQQSASLTQALHAVGQTAQPAMTRETVQSIVATAAEADRGLTASLAGISGMANGWSSLPDELAPALQWGDDVNAALEQFHQQTLMPVSASLTSAMESTREKATSEAQSAVADYVEAAAEELTKKVDELFDQAEAKVDEVVQGLRDTESNVSGSADKLRGALEPVKGAYDQLCNTIDSICGAVGVSPPSMPDLS